MANITRDELIKLKNEAPKGTGLSDIIRGLKKRGHTIEGLDRAQTRRTPQNVAEDIDVPTLGGTVKQGVKEAVGFTGRVMQAPQSLLTNWAQGVGRTLGRLIEGDTKGAIEAAKEEQRAFRDIPRQVVSGKQEEMPSPSKALGLKGVKGFAVDVLGDPLNLIDIAVKGGSQADEIIENYHKQSPRLKRWGESLYQQVVNPTTKEERTAIKQVGKTFRGEKVEAAETLGKRLSRYGVKGTLEEMIGEMNQRMGPLRGQLDEAAKASDEMISTGPIKKALQKDAKDLRKVGDNELADAVLEAIDKVPDGKVGTETALDLKRAFDKARLTPSGKLSQARRSTKQRVYRIISNNLREELNKLPKIGKLNAEISTYYDAIDELSKEFLKFSRKGAGFSIRFPFVRTGMSGARLKTGVADFLVGLSDQLQVPTNRLIPVLRELIEDLEED